MRFRFLLSIIALTVFNWCDTASADQPFYAGKRLTLLVNFAAGGPADVEGRLFAKFIGRHVAGTPSVIVQNMDGAGGIVGAKYLGAVAPRDGTMIGYFTGTAFIYALDPPRFDPDFNSYGFVALQGGATVAYVRTDIAPGIRTAADVLKAENLVVGGLSVETSKDIRMRMAFDLLGVKYKYVTGYRSSAPARLAFEKGEINAFSESTPSYRSIVLPDLVTPGKAIALWYDGGDATHPSPQMAGLPVRPFDVLYRDLKGAPPSGPLWDAYNAINAIDGAMLRVICLPPGTPTAARDALAEGVAALNADPDHAEEAMRTIGFVPQWQVGPDSGERARQIMALSPDARSFIAGYIKAANK
jgi:hypothetical protein